MDIKSSEQTSGIKLSELDILFSKLKEREEESSKKTSLLMAKIFSFNSSEKESGTSQSKVMVSSGVRVFLY